MSDMNFESGPITQAIGCGYPVVRHFSAMKLR